MTSKHSIHIEGTEWVPEGFKATQSTLKLREEYGISYSVADVAREKDL